MNHGYGQGRFWTAAKIKLLGITRFVLLCCMAIALVSATVAWLAHE